MKGMLATSCAGHDKDKVYLVMQEEKQQVILCDGDLRPLNKMKVKNKKHIQIIKQKVMLKEPITNEQIKYSIKQYLQK